MTAFIRMVWMVKIRPNMRIIEIMKKNGLGTHGHIAIGTTSIIRASSYLERNGIALDYENAKKDTKGRVTVLYLKEEILGFAVHLSLKTD